MTASWRATVNGASVETPGVPDAERLLDTLRWRLGLLGTKEGCRTGGCGACTVLVDDRATLSCLTLAREVEGQHILTVEGAAADLVGRAVQEAFARETALQCGYCTPGFVVALTGLLKERPRSTPVAELLEDLQGNLCRCTGYATIVRAVRAARESAP
ncbi:MAG: (2Fe-2S)-binding protein [Thermoplasmata archaeon]|nr:(2Fe-2S)-binding protein [Thermoplasmata archaeon]